MLGLGQVCLQKIRVLKDFFRKCGKFARPMMFSRYGLIVHIFVYCDILQSCVARLALRCITLNGARQLTSAVPHLMLVTKT